MSSDTHVGELNAIRWSERGGHDLYDLVSSPLAQTPSHSWRNRQPEVRIRPVFYSNTNFGLLEFDITLDDPELRLNLVNANGRRVWESFALSASDLRNGIETGRRISLRQSDVAVPAGKEIETVWQVVVHFLFSDGTSMHTEARHAISSYHFLHYSCNRNTLLTGAD